MLMMNCPRVSPYHLHSIAPPPDQIPLHAQAGPDPQPASPRQWTMGSRRRALGPKSQSLNLFLLTNQGPQASPEHPFCFMRRGPLHTQASPSLLSLVGMDRRGSQSPPRRVLSPHCLFPKPSTSNLFSPPSGQASCPRGGPVHRSPHEARGLYLEPSPGASAHKPPSGSPVVSHREAAPSL